MKNCLNVSTILLHVKCDRKYIILLFQLESENNGMLMHQMSKSERFVIDSV